MNYSRIAIASLTLLASASIASAQGQANQGTNQNQQQPTTQITSDPIPKKFWQVSLSDGGAYMVALSRISSISRHEYLVDGVVRVHELTVAAEGSAVVRFYHMAPVTDKSPSAAGQAIIDRLNSGAREVAKRTNTTDQLDKVSKSYPHGTHTHNVEFRVKSIANVDQLYASIRKAWYDGQGTRVSVRAKKK